MNKTETVSQSFGIIVQTNFVLGKNNIFHFEKSNSGNKTANAPEITCTKKNLKNKTNLNLVIYFLV